ncbi:MAG: M20/M25/M40 family metallo-hydrolase, partial [Anaerolineales bacterium]
GAVGEEGDSRGAKHVCQTHPAPKMVVIGEPSGWDHLTLGYKGSYWFRYRLNQPMVHTAANGASACEIAVDFWNRLRRVVAQWNEGKERLFDQLTPTLRSIQMFPDDYSEIVEMRVGMRLPPKLDQPALEALLDGVMETGERFVEDYLPAYRAEKNTPLVRAFLSAIRRAGGQPAFSLKTGTSDMNLVGPFWNCPIVAYGPGDSSLDHTPYEHLRISEYLTSVSVLTQALEIIMNTNV